ncbi:MAG TPA: DNA-binding domain-containing protein [Caulobacteraceae bacterium]|jgi:hypothetical protein|nr:DNA-binding domain-containing protein [Caulobacteraceae bacterium]
MSLFELQRQLRDHLLSEEKAIADRIRGEPQKGLAVYHHAYRAQLVDCLRDTYEKVAAWLGDDGFETSARRYIETHPPRSWTLGDYGANFVDALAVLYPDDPEVAELAWLDWALRRAFDGADAEPVDAAQLDDVDWDRAVFTFVPTLRLNAVVTNCAALWSAMAENQMPPLAERLAEAANIRVWRRDLTSHFKTISPREARALRLGVEGMSFGEICQIAIDETDEAQAVAAASELLGAWLSDGLVCRIR